MGVFDKLKNALFEVEYVEVDEEPKKEKKEKKEKPKKEEPVNDKPIAKKIVLPGKKEEKISKIQEEELVDQNFEARPKDENIKEENNNSFKFMDDADFKVDDEPIVKSVEEVNETELLEGGYTPVNNVPERETHVDTSVSYHGVSPVANEDNHLSSINSPYRPKERESRPYGMDPSYRVSIKEYGSYENSDDRDGFRPSPIISPIYGILDKNYKKEDVVSKKEVRITSNYTRRNMNVDDIRNKAYGKEKVESVETTEPIEEEHNEEPTMVDLTNDKEKPEVKELTVGDAMEYFQDLGLEYNVDYVDATNKSGAQKVEEEKEEKSEVLPDVEEKPKSEKKVIKKKEVKKTEELPEVEEDVPEVVEDTVEVEIKPVEEKNESSEELLDDDNLFDLIDSMYKEDK